MEHAEHDSVPRLIGLPHCWQIAGGLGTGFETEAVTPPLADKSSVRYNYDEMIFHFFDDNPDFSKSELLPLFSLAYGEEGFRDFYDFLMQTVPLMNKKSDLGEDV